MSAPLRTTVALLCATLALGAAELATGPRGGVIELGFTGPTMDAGDDPVRAVDFRVSFRHESGSPTIQVHGYWDADGASGTSGNRWRVRFCPTRTGRWTLVEVASNRGELAGEKQGDYVTATSSSLHGHWLVDEASAGGRWFKRQDGSHQYIVGNTHYDFLSRPNGSEASAASIREDVRDNARFFRKLRFCLFSFRSENASSSLRPFLTASGQTDSETHVPNPRFFRERVDAAVQEGLAQDLICDLIMAGTTGDQYADREGFIKYVAARYGAFPNVWFTIGQEYNEQTGSSTQKSVGGTLRGYLAYANPVSTHGTGAWSSGLNGSWHSHSIRQLKTGDLSDAADGIQSDYANNGGKPAVNDENGYDPNEASTLDVIEGITGSFAGGGYGTTGHKTGSKQGGYFWGHAARGRDIAEHPSVDELGFLRDTIDQHVAFWKLTPRGTPSNSIFSGADSGFRAMEWSGQQYVLVADGSDALSATLPAGSWEVRQVDIVAKSGRVLASSASGSYGFSTPSSRASLTIFTKVGGGDPDPVTPTAITSPAPGTTVVPGQSVTARADGENLSWNVDVQNDGRGAIATGSGSSITFTVPADATADQDVVITVSGAGGSDQQRHDIVVGPVDLVPSITTTSSELNSGTVGQPYADDVEATGGDAPLSWSVVGGALPPGLGLSGSEISGTPSAAGSFGFTLEVRDADGDRDSRSLSITIAATDDGGGADISGITAASGEPYELATLAVGSPLYIDRPYTVDQLPSAWAGAAQIRTANDDKARSDASFLGFVLDAPAEVHVAYDSRASSRPGWLAGWTDTGATIGTTDVDFRIYRRSFAAGSVTLGGNQGGTTGAGSMYWVFVPGGDSGTGGGDPVALAINFQPAGASTPAGWLVDAGAAFGDRGNGASYGWDQANGATRERNATSDQLQDTLNHCQKSGDRTWELALPDGIYRVRVVAGDPSYTDQVNHFELEGVSLVDPDGQDHFDSWLELVEVLDGRLTLRPASGASNAKLCLIEVTTATTDG